MKEELANQIINKCPKLFSSLKTIEAPDGWFHIINSASILIEQYSKTPIAQQIKSKFGGLRYYTDKTDPYVDGVIHMAEMMAGSACEFCGNHGKKVNLKGWYATLCDKCLLEKQKQNV